MWKHSIQTVITSNYEASQSILCTIGLGFILKQFFFITCNPEIYKIRIEVIFRYLILAGKWTVRFSGASYLHALSQTEIVIQISVCKKRVIFAQGSIITSY